MALVRYDPFFTHQGVSQLQNEINRIFSNWGDTESSGATAGWVPTADIHEYHDRFQLFIDLPGVDPSAVDITLERGVTHDTEFEAWANKVWNYGSGLGVEVSLQDFRKDLIIEVYNEAGQVVLAYKVYRAWVSEYQSLPDLDANANAVAIQTIKLENEGWERDYDVVEPSEPSFTEPA